MASKRDKYRACCYSIESVPIILHSALLFRGFTINIKQMTDDGLPYPEFLLEHITNEWSDVNVPLIDPDVCLKVDSSLSYCGCVVPSSMLRQFVYLYQQSHDFDYETIAILTRIAKGSADNASIWDDIVTLEFQRDCGLSRDHYLVELLAVAERVEAEGTLFKELLSA